ncbi:MAG: type II secretion system protein [Synergistaceae bacterium]|nr:type II secretion system protein [Synergistaceae bacterium]
MKKTRKGFTLLELLVVIGVMGLMGSLAMVGGQQATDAARATNIADNLEKAASAMMMFYSDQADTINTSGITAANLATGASAYLKTALEDEAAENTYFVAVSAESNATAKWYVGYKFNTNDTAPRLILANKAERMGLYSLTTGESPAYAKYAATTAGNATTCPDTVYMLVR